MRRREGFFFVGCLALLLAVPVAASAAPRTTKDCTGEPDVYARLTCRQQGILDAQGALVTRFEERFGGSADHDRKIQKMKRLNDGADKAAKRSNAAKFKGAAKKQGRGGEETCALRLMDGAADDGNGVCDPALGEKCALASDFTKECNPTKQHGKNDDCARTCVVDGIETQAEADADAAVAGELLAAYDDTESTLVEAHNKLDGAGPSLGVRLAAPAAVCPPPAPDSTASDALKIAEVALDAISSSAEPACGQTIVGVAFGFGGGGNTKWACLILEAAHAITQVAYSIVDVVQQGNQGQWYVDSVSCLSQRLDAVTLAQAAQSGDLAAVAEAVQAVKRDVAASEQAIRLDVAARHEALTGTMAAHGKEMREHFLDVMLLLSTPQGQRAGFPVK